MVILNNKIYIFFILITKRNGNISKRGFGIRKFYSARILDLKVKNILVDGDQSDA